MTLVSIFTLGFMLGMRHATDADHLAAVATLATRSRSVGQTVLQGAAWGAGHTITLMLFGGVVLAAGVMVPVRVAEGLELAVGVMLVVLGVDVLYRLRRKRVHFHEHHHADEVAHVHAHSHYRDDGPHDPMHHEHPHARAIATRALFVGMMHGLAGSAALVLLGLEALHAPGLVFAYIVVFGLGSILGMLLLSAAIAVPLRLSMRHFSGVHRALSAIVGLATLVLGVYVIFGSQLTAWP